MIESLSLLLVESGKASCLLQITWLAHLGSSRGPPGTTSPLDPPMALSPDCEAPLKKEGGLPEGPVLEALLCAETGEKKIELKEEEAIMDCQVGPLPGAPAALSFLSPALTHPVPALKPPLAP